MDCFSLVFNNLTLILVFFVTLFLVYLNTRRPKGIPPGPPCWPMIGNIGSVAGGNILDNLQKLREKYGNIYSVYFGSELNIILNGYDLIHEALVKRGSLFSLRPTSFTRMQKIPGVVTRNGESWKELRKFTLNTLKPICFRKTGITLEHRVQEETDELIKSLLSKQGEFDISTLITLSLTNVMHSILHGRRIGYVDEKFLWFVKMMDSTVATHLKQRLLQQCFPWLRYLPGDLLQERLGETQTKQVQDYVSGMALENFKNHQSCDEDCFIDFWINAYEGTEHFPQNKFCSLYGDLMAAGTETSATTLKWIILSLVKNPMIQKKLQQEIDSVLSKDQRPILLDRENLPYVEATILEGLRFGTPVPLAVPHTVSHDVVFRGFVIPKDCTVLPNLASVHFDPDIFPDPETFRPERFLNEEETKIVGEEKLIPFSLGPRSCLGETLARLELFLYLVTLVQKVEFHAPESEDLPSSKGEVGITYRPKPYKVKLVARSS